MFIDQVTIHVKAGNGGNGCVSFRREKFVPKGGPDGGTGGKGGDVILRANAQLHTLLDQKYKTNYVAKNGDPGSSARKNGKSAQDLAIRIPCGTVVKDIETNEVLSDMIEHGQEYVLAWGGKGGRGNSEFATATNQAPRYAEQGTHGEERTVILELKLLADIGLVGFPNAGKSTLISTISAARPKIADYPFTTLQPNLGIVRYKENNSFTVADIPGIISGAHEGKGLGLQFLRHIERTYALVLLLDCTSIDYEKDFRTLRNELRLYEGELLHKPYVVVFSKGDLITDEIEARIKIFRKKHREKILLISSITNTGIEALLDLMWRLVDRTIT